MRKPFLQKILNWKVGLFFALLVIVIAGILWLSYERQPLPEALAALDGNSQVSVIREPWLTFSPVGVVPTTGFIFYPGGRISYLGYSDFMSRFAAQGYLVVVPQMPLNIAAISPNVADEIITAHPEIIHWVIAGHSVGGTMAAQYTHTHSDKISGLVIWASYPADSDDLSSLDIPMMLIYGSLDPAANDSSVEPRRNLFPEHARFVRIEGGDHHQFGSYVIQPEDHHATISRVDQQQQIIQATLDLLSVVSGQQ